MSVENPQRRGSFASRLYRGEVSYEFIARRRRWYAASGIVLLVSVLSLLFRGLNPSVDFKGGAVFEFAKTAGHSVQDVRSAVAGEGITDAIVQTAGNGSSQTFRVQTEPLSDAKVTQVETAIKTKLGASNVSTSTVGASWGSQITQKAVISLLIFLVAVIVYLSARFEPKMAIAAIVALIHDLVITAGIYSLVGFEVSPSTVIALLTILGYSLYDTVVVFDKVRENTVGLAGGSRKTYSQAANDAVNQTLVRSINTSVIALLPVAGLLFVGAGLLGAGSLKDLALALFIGLASGAYSSIFIATPLLCDLKEREPAYQALARRVAARQGKGVPATASVGAGAAGRTATTVLDSDDDLEGAADAVATPSPASPRPRPAATRPAQSRPAKRKGGRGGGRPSRKRR